MLQPYEQRFPWTLDWNLLRTFMVVADQGSITRAAHFLGVKQPTVSSALKRLEDTVQQRLLNRGPHHFSLTEAGQVLYQECTVVFGAVSHIPDLLSEASTRINGHINIAMTSHVVSRHLDGLLHGFNTAHPDVTYSISISESADVLNRLRENRATLGICLMRNVDPSVESRVLFREYFALYCGRHHPLFGREDIKLSELAGESSVSFQTDAEAGALECVTHLREKAALRPALKGISANLTEVRRMIIAGLGIGALPIHVAQRDVDLGNLWRLPPHEATPAVDVCAVTNPARRMNMAEQKLTEALNDLIETVPLSDRTYGDDGPARPGG
jgi:DNA-binding transcriptional LysR family regulator